MQHTRFLVLTGHLNDYPLSDLVGILRHQQKTGRLLIEYPNGPATFFFNEGELVDAQLGSLSGLQAICVAIAQPPSAFNFNPLIRPTRRSIENSFQKVVSELLGCWGENDLEVEAIAPTQQLPHRLLRVSPSLPAELSQTALDTAPTFLALPPGPVNRFSRPTLAMAAAGLLLLGLSTVIAVTGAFGKRSLSAALPAPSHQASTDTSMSTSMEGQSRNIAKTELPNNLKVQRTLAKVKDTELSSDQPTRPESRPAIKKEPEIPGPASAPVSSSEKQDRKVQEEHSNLTTADSHSVQVVLQIEGGRVAQASIANHRSGMEAYEALALRIARQRRYPSKGATQEMITIKVSSPK